jgi:type I restriction enzyme S subunit
MNKYFIKIKLGELTEIIAGGDKPKIFSENKTSLNTFPVFANAEGNNGLLGYTNLPRIIEPAVTISARGSKVGFAALRKQPFFPIVRLLTLIPQKDKLDVDFLFYNLKLNRQNGTGSGQPQITIPEISEKIISVPPLLTQQKIASVLSALDSKIELNNRINAELEAMAKTLYDYWFVQFDFPFDFAQGKPNANGKPYKSSGGKMVWNEELKREIPEGWENGTFANYCPSTGGFAFKSNWWTDKGVAVAKIKDIQENYTLDTSDLARVDISDKEIDDKFLAKPGDVLIAMTGATVGKYAIVPITDYPIYVNQRVGYFNLGIDPSQKLPFLINSMNQSYFRNAIFTLANGAAQPNISNEQINSIQLLIPEDKLINTFNEMFQPYYKKILNNQLENQKLTELRDWLLPMLMNGQVKVMDEMENDFSMAAEPKIEYGK